MIPIKAEYLTGKDGKRKAVVIPIAQWETILEALEEFEDIQVYDEVKSSPSDPVPFEQAVAEIENRVVESTRVDV